MAEDNRSFLVFGGQVEEDCDDFIQEIRIHALREGRANDSQWTAQFASTCLIGDALRWYSFQTADVQNDWRRLQVELLARFPSTHDSDYGSPASASPLVTPDTRTPSPDSPGTIIADTIYLTGRLRVKSIMAGNLSGHYISFKRSLGQYDGGCFTIGEIHDSMQVQLVPSVQGYYQMRITNALEGKPHLALCRTSSRMTQRGWSPSCELVCKKYMQPLDPKTTHGEIRALWRLRPDMSVVALWPETDRQIEMQGALLSEGDSRSLDRLRFSEAWSWNMADSQCDPLIFEFEPLKQKKKKKSRNNSASMVTQFLRAFVW